VAVIARNLKQQPPSTRKTPVSDCALSSAIWGLMSWALRMSPPSIPMLMPDLHLLMEAVEQGCPSASQKKNNNSIRRFLLLRGGQELRKHCAHCNWICNVS